MGFFDELPLELVEMVFSHLARSGIVEATLISPRANSIISNSEMLMQNVRFRIENKQPGVGTRKYRQIDFIFVDDPPIIKDSHVKLTQLTINACSMKAAAVHALLSQVSETLELFVVGCSNFTIDEGNRNSSTLRELSATNLEPLQFPKLRTLIFVDLEEEYEFNVFACIRATNLVELGLVRNTDMFLPSPEENFDTKVISELIKLNSKLKILHIPRHASEKFIFDIVANLEYEIRLEELGLSFMPELLGFGTDCFQEALHFLETQKSTLKCLKLEGGKVEEETAMRLLSFNLVRLEILNSSMEFSQNDVIENSTIENVAFIGMKVQGNSNPEAIDNFMKCCKNLAAFVAIFIAQPGTRYPTSWRCIDTRKNLPRQIWWADYRSLRFAGVGFCIEYILDHQGYNVYRGRLREAPVEQHPYEVIRFKKCKETPSDFQV